MNHKNLFLRSLEETEVNAIIGFKKHLDGLSTVVILSLKIPASTIIFIPKANLEVVEALRTFEILSVSPGRRKSADPNSISPDDFIGGIKYAGAKNIVPLIHYNNSLFPEERRTVGGRFIDDDFRKTYGIVYS